MNLHRALRTAFFLTLILTACNHRVTPAIDTPTLAPAEFMNEPLPAETEFPDRSQVVFSELLAGVQGNNNAEFIELYNRSRQPVDLLGWSIWYRLPSSQEDIFVYRWQDSAIIPPLGHYLLTHLDQELGIVADDTFEQSLNTVSGGFQLREMDGSLQDVVGWGDSAVSFYEAAPASSMSNGLSLERLPGGNEGNHIDTNDNSHDFVINSAPHPQNTGSEITPELTEHLSISVEGPERVKPGDDFTYILAVRNTCDQDAEQVSTTIPIPAGLSVISLPTAVIQQDDVLIWTLDTLPIGAQSSISVSMRAPWTYYSAQLINYHTYAENCPFPNYGGPVQTQIEGGVIPIETARNLVGADLTIEGIVTMPTGMMYAGSGNTIFYLQDDSGGIQVYVVDGQGKVGLNIGARVTVRGNVQVYRGAMEIVPIVVPDDIVRIDSLTHSISPTLIPIHDINPGDLNLPGSLIQVEGMVSRVEEFSYSYELDLVDDFGDLATLYIDKQTNISVERIEVGQRYRVTGILDARDSNFYLNPRVQGDLEQIYPQELLLEVDAPPILTENNLITYTINIYNHTNNLLTNISVVADIPENTTLSTIDADGALVDSQVVWIIDELEGNGSRQEHQFTVRVKDPAPESIMLHPPKATSDELPVVVAGNSIRTFSGGKIPVWAIQGDGFRSSYVFKSLTTEGIVTGVFPDLGGFFIQEADSDTDPLTSPGLFVSTSNLELPIYVGDLLEITGVVRELSNQTAVQVTDMADIWIKSQGNPVPIPTEIDPPVETARADIYFEAIEGSYVRVSGPAVAISPTSKYGEYVIVLSYHNTGRLFQGDDNGYAIMVDDGMSIVHSDNSMLSYSITTGDVVGSITGPLAYTYGRYKIEPVQEPDVQEIELTPIPIEPPASGQFSIMSWNVENLFDYLDPNPTDPPRPTFQQYQNSLAKAANTILMAGSPSIVALQEVENIGVLHDLADHALLDEFKYQPILLEGTDSRGIDVGYLIRIDQGQVIKVEQKNTSDELFSRPPLVLEVQIDTAAGNELLFLINNHFVSMSGGVDLTEPQRTAQAGWNAALAREIQAEYPGARIAVLGDMNSFYDSLPINELRDSGLHHVLDELLPGERYTYIFEGQSQVLDHILVTSALWEEIIRVEILHLNSDFPPQDSTNTSAIRKSDHDPVVVTFAPEYDRFQYSVINIRRR